MSEKQTVEQFFDKQTALDFLKEHGYSDEEIDETFSLDKKMYGVGVFSKNKPHDLKNCEILITEFISKNEKNIKKYFDVFIQLKYLVISKNNEYSFYEKLDDVIYETFAIPFKNQKLDLPKRTELKEVKNLMRIFNIIHNHIYANDGLSPNETFNEILKILFLKIYDERNESGIYVKFGLSDSEYFKIMEGQTTEFKSRIGELFEKAKKNFQDVFTESESLNLKDATLAFVIGQLQYFNLSKSKHDIKGTAFQKFIYSQQRGSRGQFLTPEPIIKLAVNIIKPKSSDNILDPSCGAAGFLIEAMNFVTNNEFAKLDKNSRMSKRKIFSSNLHGIEINPTMIKVAKMRMLFENDGHTEILRSDGLSEWSDLQKDANFQNLTKSPKMNTFDIILTNPPFGTQGKITNKSILKRFDLGYSWKSSKGIFEKSETIQNSQVPDILFLERCLSFLNENGKMAMVLPVGDLENKTMSYVRKYILEHTKVLAVVSLPSETFIPFGTGVKACIIFLQKMDKEKLEKEIGEDYRIFFSIIKKVGYQGNKNGNATYKKDNNGEHILDQFGNQIIDEDISEVITAFQNFENDSLKMESDLGFTCRYSELEDRLAPEFYRLIFKELLIKLKKLNSVPLHNIAKIVYNRTSLLKNKENDVRYVEISNINPSLSELSTFSEMKVHELPSRASYELMEGDIVTSVAGVSTGTNRHATAYVSKAFSGCICTNGLRIIRNPKVDPFYLLAYLRSDYFLLQMLRYRTGAAIPAVDTVDFQNMLVILPDSITQQKISKEIKQSQEYREKSKKILDDIKLLFNHQF